MTGPGTSAADRPGVRGETAQAFIYVTAANRAEALSIGRTLVEERLVACVNVLDGVRSLYWWEGKVQEDDEALFVAKTRSELAARVVARVKELHSYRTPCVVALPIADGNPDFLDWISAETGPQR
jgi:periplasmic divalent cation tolerance protein